MGWRRQLNSAIKNETVIWNSSMAQSNSPVHYNDLSTFALRNHSERIDFPLPAGRSALFQVKSILRTEGTY